MKLSYFYHLSIIFLQHGGDDVNIFAVGPMAHLFSRTHDQTHIANVMAYSACIGPYKDESISRCTSKVASSGNFVILISFVFLLNL